MIAEPARIVVRPPNWLGDAVMALPSLAAVRRHFPGAHLTVAAVPAVASIFREITETRPDAVIDLGPSSRVAIATLEGEGFDLGILFPNSFRSAWQFWRAGIGERWGYGRSARRFLLTRLSRPPHDTGEVHQADYYRRLVIGLGIACGPDEEPSIMPRPSSVERANALLVAQGVSLDTTLVGLAPGAAYGTAKQWLPDRVAEVAARLIASHDATCVIVGASHDREPARAIESWFRANAPALSSRLVNLTGRTSLRTLVGVIGRTSVFVANDSGAMHLAAALGRPVVAVFGPTNERVTRPLGGHRVLTASVFCRPCMLRDCPIDHRCMRRVTADAVYTAAADALAGTVDVA